MKQTNLQRPLLKGQKKIRHRKESGSELQSFGNIRTEAAPASVGNLLKNVTSMKFGSGIKHTEYGSGVRVSGTQLFKKVQPINTVFQAALFSTSPDLANSNGSTVFINPGGLNGRFANIAVNFLRFAFRKMRLIYIPSCATTTDGNFAISYSSDSGLFESAILDTSYEVISQMEPMVVSSYWTPSELCVTYTGDRTWYVAYSNGGDLQASLRQGCQGVFAGAPDRPGNTGAVFGEIYLQYECDLYQPVAYLQSETLFRSSKLFHEIAALFKDPKNREKLQELIKKSF